eukprot:9461757-Pyramimonas_sp.AAC.1
MVLASFAFTVATSPYPDMRRPSFLRTASPEVPTLSPGPVLPPESSFDGVGAQRGPPGAENSEKPSPFFVWG